MFQMPVINDIDGTKEIRVYEKTNEQAETPILGLTDNALAQHEK